MTKIMPVCIFACCVALSSCHTKPEARPKAATHHDVMTKQQAELTSVSERWKKNHDVADFMILKDSIKRGMNTEDVRKALGDPLGAIRQEVVAWGPLLSAQFFPFAQWGDGWGPMCLDLSKESDGDFPVVWMDHEELCCLSREEASDRTRLEPLAKPLYGSFKEFFADTFGEVTS